jgi:HEAT repeat protein
MLNFLRDLQLDRQSFWLGFIAGTLFWLFINRLMPLLRQGLKTLRQRSQAARESLQAGTRAHLADDTLRLAQRQHIASALFSLDEAAIQPRLMAPPPQVEPGIRQPLEDITDHALPYLPDWPELASTYNGPTLTLVEALQGERNLALMGRPGSGKTVALAFLAIQVLRGEELGVLSGRIPFLVHADDLPFAAAPDEGPLGLLTRTLARQVSLITQPRLPAFCKSVLEDGKALLLLDGLDELDPPAQTRVHGFVAALLEAYPGTRVVAAVSPTQQADLPSLGFAPVALAAWTLDQRRAFTHQWGRLWASFVQDPSAGDGPEPSLLNGWMLNDTTPYSPLELTLKVWAAYAGDARGFTARDALEAHLRRMTSKPNEHKQPGLLPEARTAMQRIATRLTLSKRTTAHQLEVESWLTGKPWRGEAQVEQEPEFGESPPEPEALPLEDPAPEQPGSLPGISPQKVLPLLIENGLLVERTGGRLAVAHPVFTGYLVGEALISAGPEEDCEHLIAQEDWIGRRLGLHYLAAHSRALPWLASELEDIKSDPLQRRLFTAARWLPDAPGDAAWRSEVMRRLVGLLQNENAPLGMRARAITALGLSNSIGVDMLFRQLLAAPTAALRHLGALGVGLLKDGRAVNDLCGNLYVAERSTRRATCLALAAIGDKPALEALAEALLQGDEDLRLFAGEALANHSEEGHPTLEEAAAHEDLLVRRAAVAGLARIRLPWATALLEKMQLQDSQWVVQNAASQAIEERQSRSLRAPQAQPELHNTPWLIAYASEKGIGVVPGQPAAALLLKAAAEGDIEQRLAAMQRLVQYGDRTAPATLYQNYFDSQPELQEAALTSLWLLAAKGVELPPPVQYWQG